MILKVSKTSCINGSVKISGSKNSSLALISAALLSKEEVVLSNVPIIDDVLNLLEILKSIGVHIHFENNILTIHAKKINYKIDSSLVEKLRGSIYLMGALLARTQKIEMSSPGGCNFCDRPIDLHLYAANLLGYNIKSINPIIIKANKIYPNTIVFSKKSVGATINAILMASSIEGVTTIINPSFEPEVLDVCKFLGKMNVLINIKEQENKICIKGVKKITKTINYSIYHEVIPDRIEAGSYLLLAASIPHSKLELTNVCSKHLTNVLILLKSLGLKITKNNNTINLISPLHLKNTDLIISEYPFFPTDLQQILSATLLRGSDVSKIEDQIFPKRISHIEELKKLNANIIYENNQIIIKPSILNGGIVTAHDLRCAMALIIGGAMADGVTLIEKGEYLLRGYENPLQKMRKIGVLLDVIY